MLNSASVNNYRFHNNYSVFDKGIWVFLYYNCGFNHIDWKRPGNYSGQLFRNVRIFWSQLNSKNYIHN